MNLRFSEKSEFGFDITHIKSETNFCRNMSVKKEEVLDEKEKKIQLTEISEITQKLPNCLLMQQVEELIF